MKKINEHFKFLLIVASAFLYACGGGDGNTGSHVTEIDSSADSDIILHKDQIGEPGDDLYNPGTSVKVEMGNASDFNWEDFRNTLSAKEEAIGEGFHMGEDEVATAWEKLNDRYRYQTRYRYHNGELWMRTYYLDNSDSLALSEGEGTLLRQDQAEKNPDFQELWKKMEDRANELRRGQFD